MFKNCKTIQWSQIVLFESDLEERPADLSETGCELKAGSKRTV